MKLLKRYKKRLISLIVCLAVVAFGTVSAVVAANYRANQLNAVQDAYDPERPANVRVQELEPRDLTDRITITGTVEPWEARSLSAEVGGRIEWQGAEAGDTVASGQELFRIDTEAIRARLRQLEAQHRLAAQELARAEEMAGAGIGTRQQVERLQAEYDVAAASVESARIDLRKSVVRAPFDGVVDAVHREDGEFTEAGAPLVRLVQLDRVRIVVGVSERDAPLFHGGSDVEIAVDAFPEDRFTGEVHRVATSAELATRTFETEIAVDNPDRRLRPGMIARAHLVRNVYPDAILVPIFAVISLDEERYVFVEKDGRAQMRSIEIGVIQGNDVQVTNGLSPGDRLIVVGQRDLRAGESVRVETAGL